MSQSPARAPADASAEPRRNFLIEAAAGVLGGLLALFPLVVGVVTFLHPLRRKSAAAGDEEGFLRIAPLDGVPDDGVPRRFPVIATRFDAWTVSPNERVGAVYLSRAPGSDEVVAFNAICPHAGCFVAFDEGADRFQCPCHTSMFTKEGARIGERPVSPRDLDTLETRVADGSVLVKFENFYPGKHDKVAKT